MNKRIENLLIFSVVGVTAYFMFGKKRKKRGAASANDGFIPVGANGLMGNGGGGYGGGGAGNLTSRGRVAADAELAHQDDGGHGVNLKGGPECVNGTWSSGAMGGQPCSGGANYGWDGIDSSVGTFGSFGALFGSGSTGSGGGAISVEPSGGTSSNHDNYLPDWFYTPSNERE